MAYQVDRLYSYIVAHDGGFAPNPFRGMCTLACCKPKIRKSIGKRLKVNPEAKIWVVGLSSKDRDKGNDIIYIMQVTCAMNFADYWRSIPRSGLSMLRERLRNDEGTLSIDQTEMHLRDSANSGRRIHPIQRTT